MKHLRLGRSGLKVSRICLGTMTFGAGADDQVSFQLMDRFLELGGTFLDTADQYSMGVSEEVVGRWIRARGVRDQVVLATKVFTQMGPGANDGGLSRIHIQRAVEDSLRRLQTDVIDLYQIHRWDFTAPPEETLEALNDLVRQGKVRYIGCSNLKAWHLSAYLQLAREQHRSRFISLQPIYNVLNRGIENEVLELCAREGLGVIVYNPLAGGVLTGKYGKGITDGRLTLPGYEWLRQVYESPEGKERIEKVEKLRPIAADLDASLAQLALAWALKNPNVSTVITGASRAEQVTDNMKALDIVPKLDDTALEAIEAVLDNKPAPPRSWRPTP